MATKILFIEKGGSNVNSLSHDLVEKGYEVSVAHSTKEAISQVESEKPDLIILDATWPKFNGQKACKALRQQVGDISIILLTPKGEKIDEGLQVEAHLTQPFTSRKLINRIRTIVGHEPQNVIQIGDLTLNVRARRVVKGTQEHKLTPKQAKLLEVFMRNSGKVLSRRVLMKEVWDTDYLGDTRTLDVHVRWVREKIEENPSSPAYLRTVRGIGYRFDLPEDKGKAADHP